jgi:hypothetical protein
MSRVIVVYGGGFQPFHTGHMSSYVQSKHAFPKADLYVAASNDTKIRPIPFAAKKFLAQQAGVKDPFVQVVAPISPKEILDKYNPEQDIFILVRSERDPVGYTKKDGSPGYFQPFVSLDKCEPFVKHGYVFVTKKHVFNIGGVEIFSGSQVRSMYAKANDTGKAQLIKGLYPKSSEQRKIKMVFDKYLSGITEGNKHNKLLRKQADARLGKEIISKDPKKNVPGTNPLVVGRQAQQSLTLEQRLQKELMLIEAWVDLTGKPCKKCRKGKYQETGFHDDMDGVLHCTNCGTEIERYANKIDFNQATRDFNKSKFNEGARQPTPNFKKNMLTLLKQKYPQAQFTLRSDRIESTDGKLCVIADEMREGAYAGVYMWDVATGPYRGVMLPAIKQTTEQLLQKNPKLKPALFIGGDNQNPEAWEHIAKKLRYKLITDEDEELDESVTSKPIKPFNQVKQYPLDALLTGYGNGQELQASPEYKRDIRRNKQRLAQKNTIADRVKRGYSNSNDEGDWAQE